jgi:hypothetical protein
VHGGLGEEGGLELPRGARDGVERPGREDERLRWGERRDAVRAWRGGGGGVSTATSWITSHDARIAAFVRTSQESILAYELSCADTRRSFEARRSILQFGNTTIVASFRCSKGQYIPFAYVFDAFASNYTIDKAVALIV